MRVIVVLLALASMVAGWANDGFMRGIGGSWTLMHGEHTSIRMVREWVHMDIHPMYYDVTATFRFQNDGGPVTVTMGFPEKGGGVDTSGKTTYFQHFETTVDGETVPVKRVVASMKDEDYEAYWIKRVPFAAGQVRSVRVSYRSQPADDSSIGPYGACYVFSGGNWKGKVERSDLTVDFHLPGVSVVSTDGVQMKQQGNRLTHSWTNWEAEKGFNVTYLATLPGWLMLRDAPLDYLMRPVYQIIGPGKAQRIQWYPPAMMSPGRPFIALRDFADAVDRRAWHRGTAVVRWDAPSNDYLIRIGKRTVRFRRGSTSMRIEGGETVVLPAAPFTQQRPYGVTTVFVPLMPLARAFGGTATVNEVAHLVQFDLPIFHKTK